MVLTRSQRKKREMEQKRQGKSNTTESSESTDQQSSSPQPASRKTRNSQKITTKTAKKTPRVRQNAGRTPANRTIKRQTSNNNNVGAPSATTPLSNIVGNLPTNQLDQYLSHLNIFNKTDSTFRLWSCVLAMTMTFMVSYFVCNSKAFVDGFNQNFFVLETLMLAMVLDILISIAITLEIPLGDFFSHYAIEFSLISESMVHAAKLVIILQICDVFDMAYGGTALAIELSNMLFQIAYKDSESGLIRICSTVTLLLAFGSLLAFPDYDHLSKFTNTKLLAVLLVIQTVVDGFDFPDKYFNHIVGCEAIVMGLRTATTYLLVGARLLQLEEEASKIPVKPPI